MSLLNLALQHTAWDRSPEMDADLELMVKRVGSMAELRHLAGVGPAPRGKTNTSTSSPPGTTGIKKHVVDDGSCGGGNVVGEGGGGEGGGGSIGGSESDEEGSSSEESSRRKESSGAESSDEDHDGSNMKDNHYVVAAIKDWRFVRGSQKKMEFLVQWDAPYETETTWEPEENMVSATRPMKAFLAEQQALVTARDVADKKADAENSASLSIKERKIYLERQGELRKQLWQAAKNRYKELKLE